MNGMYLSTFVIIDRLSWRLPSFSSVLFRFLFCFPWKKSRTFTTSRHSDTHGVLCILACSKKEIFFHLILKLVCACFGLHTFVLEEKHEKKFAADINALHHHAWKIRHAIFYVCIYACNACRTQKWDRARMKMFVTGTTHASVPSPFVCVIMTFSLGLWHERLYYRFLLSQDELVLECCVCLCVPVCACVCVPAYTLENIIIR